MNETEFRTALHDVMTQTDQPAPMDPNPVLVTAQSARRRRQGVIAATGAVVAVVVVTTLAAVLPLGGSSGQVVPSGPTTSQPDVVESMSPADISARLLDDLTAARPDGFSAPDLRTKPQDGQPSYPLRDDSATLEDDTGENEVWQFTAHMPIAKDGRTGRLYVIVDVPGDDNPTDLCEFALANTYSGGVCDVLSVEGGDVAIVEPERVQPADPDRFALIRYGDGTVVTVGQAKEEPDGVGLKPLTELPFTDRELAGLAADERFHLK